MALLKLAVEDFQLIFNFLDHVHLGRLVLTCPALKQVITTTASVYRVVIRDMWSKVSLPTLICDLPYLRELVISSNQYRYNVPIAKLPNTLWKLSFRHSNSYEALCGIDNFTPQGGITSDERGTIVDLKSVLPELRTLMIEGAPMGVSNIHNIVFFLPSTLTCLDIRLLGMGPLLSNESHKACTNQLPPGLITLKLVSCSQFTPENDISHLSHLERLSLPNCSNIPTLPSNITHLTLRTPSTSTDLNAQLPHLLHLKFLDRFEQSDFIIPSTLVKYSIPTNFLALSANTSVLPESLKKLTCAGFTLGVSPSAYALGVDRSSWISGILPSGLKTIQCSNPSNFLLQNIDSARKLQRFLPPALESFNIELGNLNLKYLPLFPNTLRSLPCPVQISKTTFLRDGGDFPETLKPFDLATIFPYLERVVLNGGNEKCSPFIFSFPSTLVALEVDMLHDHILPDAQHSFAELHRGRWPAKLQSLTYRDWFYPTDAGISGLPSTLVTLSLQSTMVNRIEAYRSAHEFTARGLSELPPKLETLQIGQNLEHVLPSFFAHLPNTLTSLDLPFYDNCRDADIKHLPNALTRIALRNSTKLTNAALPFLPTSITFLDIRSNLNITPECLPHLPKALKWLDLRKNTKFPKRMEVPRSLHLKTKYISDGW